MSDEKQVLIIDDDSRNIFALTAVLKSKGFRVVSASNMVEAFSVLESKGPVGIILMDMMMPGMDGYEATGILKTTAAYEGIPIIAVTAQAMAGDKERSLQAGADGYIAKPVDVDVLIDVLNQYLK